MEQDELYPELIDYIFHYCGNHFWEKEMQGNKHLHALSKSKSGTNVGMYKFFQERGFVSDDKDVLRINKGWI